MTHQFLTNYSVAMIKYNDNNQYVCLGNQSFIRSEILLTNHAMEGNFENYLFYVETGSAGDSDFKVFIEFEHTIVFRHKISNKYLSYSAEFQDEENDSTVRLQLSDKKCFFKIIPCFQYQTKISNKVKFNEDIYIATELNSARLGYLSVKLADNQEKRTVIGLNFKSKMVLHSYEQIDKEDSGYMYGQSVWLGHIESGTFLTTLLPDGKSQIAFQREELEDDLQSINGLWLIESTNAEMGGSLRFNDAFRLKSLCTDRYLSFSQYFKVVEKEKIYSIQLVDKPSEMSKFVFQSLKGEENKIIKGAYLIFKHMATGEFIGTRRQKSRLENEYLPILTFSQFEDEDLFEIRLIGHVQQEAIRFVFSVKKELKFIRNCLLQPQPLKRRQLQQISGLYSNIINELRKLSLLAALFEDVQEELGTSIGEVCLQILSYRGRQEGSEEKQKVALLIRSIYQILKVLCKDYSPNQLICYKHLSIFTQDIFKDYGAEQLISQIFCNNYSLLCKLPNSLPDLGNTDLMHKIFDNIQALKIKEKNSAYWDNITKIFNMIDVLLCFKGNTIDINQRQISTELFSNGTFSRIFLEIKVSNQRIRIYNPYQKRLMEMEQVRDPQLSKIVEKSCNLFAKLCEKRNFISKRYVHEYLNGNNPEGVEVMISYLNVPLSPHLSNNLFSLITNCYIDSSPRINRKKPLAVIIFAFAKDHSSRLSVQEAELSGRLKETLLNKAEKSYYSRPLNISNILSGGMNLQPSLNGLELSLFKQELSEKIRQNIWSEALLRSISILISLESYSDKEILEVKEMVYAKVLEKDLPPNIITSVMKILEEICIYCEERELKKETTYLKYRFATGVHTINGQQIAYLLPHSKLLPAPKLSKEGTLAKQSTYTSQYRSEFNEYVGILGSLYPKKEFVGKIFQMFINGEKHSFQILSSIFQMILRFNFPKLNFIRLLAKCIVITADNQTTFETLFELYKKVNHITSISEYWLCSPDENAHEAKEYVSEITEFTHYMFEDYTLNTTISKAALKNSRLNINRQLLLHNIGIHEVVINLLASNFYHLESKTVSQLSRKLRNIFDISFQFLYCFCLGCPQNIKTMVEKIEILDRFRSLAEVGQTRLLILLYRHHPPLIKQVRLNMIEKIIGKIIKDPKSASNDACEYNPQYVQFLLCASKINGKAYKQNLPLMYKSIEKEANLKKFLFLEEVGGRSQLCLNISKYGDDPVRVPYLYHKKVFRLVNTLIQSLDSSGNMLKNRIKAYVSMDDIFKIMALPDIYSHTGIVPELNFLLKKEMIALLNLYLQKNDSLSKLYDSQPLDSMLDHLINIFLTKKEKREIRVEGEQLFIPYLEEHQNTIYYDKRNQRDYFCNDLRPFLAKLYAIFEKISNKAHNRLYKKLYLLLDSVKPQELMQDHLLKQTTFGIDHITLKWRNFVDDDEDNSNEEKFVKKTLLEILRHDRAYSEVEKELEQFHLLILKKEEKYLKVMSKLIKMASEDENIAEKMQESLQIFYKIIHSLADYFVWRMKASKAKKGWQGQELIETLIGYITRHSFEFNNFLARKTFYEILRIFVFLLEDDKEGALLKIFYKIFQENNTCFRFFNCLRDSIAEVSDRIESNKFHEQIDLALSDLYMCGEERKCELDKQALKFIRLLCRHEPFTDLLRNQPYSSSTDFLDKIYNTFYFMIKKSNEKGLIISITVVDISEALLNCVQALINGCNEANQNFVVDNKFPDVVIEALKVEAIHDIRDKGEMAKRDRLLQEVVQFYQSNGIEVESILLQKIKLLDFNNIYLLNRLKYTLLKTLLQCTLANERALSKVRIMVPIELLKINLIWIYQDFIDEGITYSEETILRKKDDWDKLIQDQNLSGIFLMIGFYYYHLIQYHNSAQKQAEEGEAETANDVQKEKEKIVKKFFNSISEKEKKKQKMSALQKQPFAEQMTMFYNKYYEAYEFYKKKTLSLEINVHGHLVKLYFPKIPLCNKITQKLQQKLIEEAARISQDEKIKSLLHFQDQTYKVLQGEQDFFKEIEERSAMAYGISQLVKDEEQVFFYIWIVAVLVVLTYLINDFDVPKKIFANSIAFFIIPVSFLDGLLLILVLINVVFAILLLLNLFIKKIPFFMAHYGSIYEFSEEKQQGGMANHKNVYRIKRTIGETFYDIYVIVCCSASLMHPLFTGFLLAYIVTRISLGQKIITAIYQTWFSFLVATGLLIVFNYIYSIYIYTAFTTATGYGQTCTNLFVCLLMLLDQSLKAGSGFLSGNTSDYVNMTLNAQVLSEIVYIIFAQKVIFEIFAGTIIDKFSELREKGDSAEEDQKSTCYICGQERFQIDFELEGFDEHVSKTHNKLHYIYYLFYLRRKSKEEYGIEEDYVWNCLSAAKHDWIPDGTSLLKEEKEKQDSPEETKPEDQIYEEFYQKKLQEFKKMRIRLELLSAQLKEENI